jgi:hypothetical protein
MNLLPEDELLFLCCRGEIGGMERNESRHIQKSGIDWNLFLDKARKEGVSPIVFSALPGIIDDNGAVPSHVTDELKKDYLLCAKKNILTFHVLGKVINTFRNAGLFVMVLKGAALAETAYGNPALRPMSDVDLLIKKEELFKINEEFKKMDYFTADRPVEKVDFSSSYLTTLDYRTVRKNSPSFHVHWHLVNSTIPNDSYMGMINMEDIRRDAITENIADTEAFVMSPHHLIIHLAEHALRVTHSLSRLIHFCDIDRSIYYYGKMLDWDLLVKNAVKFKLDRMVYLTLYFSRYFIQAKVPEEVLRQLKPNKFTLPEKIFLRKIAENRRSPGMSYLIHYSMNKGFLKKTRFVARTLFPPEEILAQRSYIASSEMNYRYYFYRVKEALSYIFKM